MRLFRAKGVKQAGDGGGDLLRASRMGLIARYRVYGAACVLAAGVAVSAHAEGEPEPPYRAGSGAEHLDVIVRERQGAGAGMVADFGAEPGGNLVEFPALIPAEAKPVSEPEGSEGEDSGYCGTVFHYVSLLVAIVGGATVGDKLAQIQTARRRRRLGIDPDL